MFEGERTKVNLECKNELMKYDIDRFGEDVETKPKSDERFVATVEVSLSPNFYAWVFRFAASMRIFSPNKAKQQIKSMAEDIIEI